MEHFIVTPSLRLMVFHLRIEYGARVLKRTVSVGEMLARGRRRKRSLGLEFGLVREMTVSPR